MEGVCWATKPQRLWVCFEFVRVPAVSFVQCDVVGENLAPALQAKKPTVFVGVGKLKDYKL